MEDIEHRPISIPKATIDLLLKQDEPAGLMSLYLFYYYTAIWQETNQPRVTTAYVVKGLKISEARVRRYKKTLLRLHLIKEVIKRDEQQKITGHFIRVRYYVRASVAESHRVVKQKGNAYSSNSKTVVAKNHDELISLEKPSFSSKCSQKLEKIIRAKRRIYRTVDQRKWAQHFLTFRIGYGLKKSRITKVLNWYIAHFGDKFVPVAYSAKTFCDKFFQIEDARNRYNKDVDEGRIAPKVVGRITKHTAITSDRQGCPGDW